MSEPENLQSVDTSVLIYAHDRSAGEKIGAPENSSRVFGSRGVRFKFLRWSPG